MLVTPVLAKRLRAGETIVAGWCGMPEPLVAESVARAGFEAVVLEVQHGLHDIGSVMRGIAAVNFGGAPAIVRVPVGDNATASRVLDMGAEGVIAPMINTAAEARALAAATKYPPLGERSWGPNRVLAMRGTEPQQHLTTDNAVSVTFGMIETRRALDALEEIASVDGIDGLFVGPSDLSVTLSDGARIAPLDPNLDPHLRRIADAALKRGKFPGIYAATPDRARHFRDLGFRFIAMGADHAYLANGAKAMLSAYRA
ncbi:MAG TPA: aldolase/citrate lyase family protein [Bauldia sp.]|nr:aldolase/citrate lyase family protein [Bauldia sp.]